MSKKEMFHLLLKQYKEQHTGNKIGQINHGEHQE